MMVSRRDEPARLGPRPMPGRYFHLIADRLSGR